MRWMRANILGLVLVGSFSVFASILGSTSSYISTPVLALLLGFLLANIGLVGPWAQPALNLAARQLLKIAIALLGFRLAFSKISEIGSYMGILTIVAVVFLMFIGAQKIGSYLGVSKQLSLLVATGFSICGLSAIAAMQPLSGADEEEVGYALGLVTLFGSLSIVALPLMQIMFDLDASEFGWWVGLAVHDTGQVVATASIDGDAALDAAVLVKMVRILMLAPILIGVSFLRKGVESGTKSRRPIIPLFIVGFIGAAALRSADILSNQTLEAIGDLRSFLITAAMFGLGSSVRVVALRNLGGRPLFLGFISWIVIIVFAGAGVSLSA